MTTVAEYVNRHYVCPESTRKLIVLEFAFDANAIGRSFLTYAEIAKRVCRTERTVKWHMARVLVPGGPIRREGRSYLIVGYADHDPAYCPHGDCIIEAAGDELAVRRRRQAAERARKYRERRQRTG